MTVGPPRWARRLATWLVPSPSQEFVLGDLEELFHEDETRIGKGRAVRAYLGRAAASWLRHVLSGGPVEDLVLDLRFAIRGLRRNPTFTLVAGLTVAVGIGATTAMLSVSDAVLRRPPPIADPGRVASIWELRSGDVWESMEGRLLRYERFEAYRARGSEIFEDVAAHGYRRVAVGTDGGAVPVSGFITSGNYFEMLGLAPVLGSLYTDDHEASVVLSERLWRARFGADPDAVGRTVSIDSRSFEVVGVVGGGFVGTMSTFTGDVWLPWGAFTRLTGVSETAVRVVPLVRLRSDVPRDLAEEWTAELARSIDPVVGGTVRGARFEDLLWRSDIARILRIGAAILVATAGLLLAIAAANIGGMMLARSYDRRKEMAVRLAIGAGGGRLVRQLLVESCLLALLGGAGGVLLAHLGVRWLSRIDFPIDATLSVDLGPDRRVLLASFALALTTGVLFGLGPALASARTDLSTTLKEGARGLRSGGRRSPFVIAQLALSTVLLLTAGVLVRSFDAMTDLPLGFDPEGVTVATLSLGTHGYDGEETRAFYGRLAEGARRLPSVESVGWARFVMLGGANASTEARPADVALDDEVLVGMNVVDPGWFETMRVEAVGGRLFDQRDAAGRSPVTVVNETLAARFWPQGSPVGRVLRRGGTEYEVVGVVPDGVYAFVYDGPVPYAFFPLTRDARGGMALHVRVAEGGAPVAPLLRALVRDLDPNVAPSGLRTMEDVVGTNTFGARFIAGLATMFSGVGLLLAALGVYGLLAVQVAQQSRELGVRMAMGADPREVLLLVMRRGGRFAVVGCGLGVAIAFGVGRWLAPLLYAVSPFDALTYAVVPALLAATVVVASMVPARRGTRVDPTVLLRDE